MHDDHVSSVFKKDSGLPQDAEFASSSPVMTESSILPGLLKAHMAPAGMCAVLKVESGSVDFVWEDTGEVIHADPEHPVLIDGERLHHVQLAGPVRFRIDFYHLAKKGLLEEGCGRSGKKCCASDVDRPGTAFVKKN